MTAPLSQKSRNVILSGGPHNGTMLDSFTGDELIFKMGKYCATGNVINEREIFEWELKE